jgi:glucose/arabinose dehydrogenase
MPKKVSQGHYGSRIVFRTDGTMFVTLGERQMPIDATNEAQSLASQLGKVVRINTDGSIPADNPYAADAELLTRPVWSYGHRNPQAAALHPATGDLCVTEHGPQGGDEVNLSLPKRNFGWAIVSYGCNYGDPVGTSCRIGGGVHSAPYTPPLAFCIRRDRLAAQCSISEADSRNGKGTICRGLAGRHNRLVLNTGNTAIVGQEPFFAGQHEIRDLKQGPDGWISMISRNANAIYRIER